jgi:hypothetical protein
MTMRSLWAHQELDHWLILSNKVFDESPQPAMCSLALETGILDSMIFVIPSR